MSGASHLPETMLAKPPNSGRMSVEQALASRRSQRVFASTPLSHGQLSQLAWAAQGITDTKEGFRTAPSAGALYPLELYFATPDGLLHYVPERHSFERRSTEDLRAALADAAYGQDSLRLAPCNVIITSVTSRTRAKYGDRAPRYVALEAGHVAQNLLLEATAHGLGGVPIAAFDEAKVSRLLDLPADEAPLYSVAIGYPQASVGRRP